MRITFRVLYGIAIAAWFAVFTIDNIRNRRKHLGKETYIKKTWLQSIFTSQNLLYLFFALVAATAINAEGIIAANAVITETEKLSANQIVFKSIRNAAEMFGFSYDTDIISDGFLYLACYSLSALLCAASIVFTLLRAAFSQISNDIELFFSMVFRHNSDVVVGTSEKAFNYVKKNKDTVLWIPFDRSKEDDFSWDKYRRIGLLYYHAPFNEAEIMHFIHPGWISAIRFVPNFIIKHFGKKEETELREKELHFIFFSEENNGVLNVSEIFSRLHCKHSSQAELIKIYTHIEVGNEIEPFAKFDLINKESTATAAPEQSASDKKTASYKIRVLSDTFNVYSSIANEFVMKYGLAKELMQRFSLPQDEDSKCTPLNPYIDSYGELREECTINTIFIGYGKVNSAIFRKVVEHNQFCSFDKKKNIYHAHPVNYIIFDNDEEKLKNDTVLARLQMTENFCSDDDLPDSEELDKLHSDFFNNTLTGTPEWKDDRRYRIERPCNIRLYSGEEGTYPSDKIDYIIKDTVNVPGSFTMIFVGIENDLNNYRHAQQIVHMLKQAGTKMKRVQIFCNFDEVNSGILGDYPALENSIYLYGSKNILAKREAIINKELAVLAQNKDLLYGNNSKIPDSWYADTNFERESSIASSMHINFKLNLLGLALTKDLTKPHIDRQAFDHYYWYQENPKYYNNNTDSRKEYEKYFDQSPKAVLCYCEHLRWCAYYYINGFDPEPVTMFSYPGKEYVTDGKPVPDDVKKEYLNSDFNIRKKDEHYRFHGCLRNFYGVDALHMYMSNLAQYCSGRNRVAYLTDNETFRYDTVTCDNLWEILDKEEYNLKKKDVKQIYNIVKIKNETINQ